MATDAEAIGLPFEEAIAYFRGKIPVKTQHWTDVWRTSHARGFMVAGAASDALLADFQASIRKALEHGTTLAEFRKDFDAIVAKHGWVHNGGPAWRSRVIYETNLATAYSAGRYSQMTEPDTKRVYPFWQYVHSGSSHPRLQHLAWNGLTLSCDDPFWSTHYPPNGWHCGCRVRPVSEPGLKRMGKDGPDAAPPLETREWRNPKTGEVHDVPKGIDPGFDYSPGQAWKEAPARAPNLRPVERLPPSPTDQQQDAVRAFVRKPSGSVEIGQMREDVRRIIGTPTPKVLLSDATMAKQARRHPDMTEDDYLLAAALLGDPTVALRSEQPRHLLLLMNAGNKVLGGVVKTTSDGSENYLVTLHWFDDRSVRRTLRRLRISLGERAKLSGGRGN